MFGFAAVVAEFFAELHDDLIQPAGDCATILMIRFHAFVFPSEEQQHGRDDGSYRHTKRCKITVQWK